LLEADRETTEFIKRQKAKAAVNAANGSHTNSTTSLQGLEEHYEPIRKGADRDMFAVQDRVFSRFAASMMTGFNGTIWHEFPGVKFCSNCGDKTLICPHKMPVGETVFEVPAGTRFLKFSRPRLQYNQFMIKRSLDLFKKSDSYQNDLTWFNISNTHLKYCFVILFLVKHANLMASSYTIVVHFICLLLVLNDASNLLALIDFDSHLTDHYMRFIRHFKHGFNLRLRVIDVSYGDLRLKQRVKCCHMVVQALYRHRYRLFILLYQIVIQVNSRVY
jgi:hypothetical protein